MEHGGDRQSCRVATVDPCGLGHLFSLVEDACRDDFTCPVCLSPFEVPRQVICNGVDEGHRACAACLGQILESNSRCPGCNSPCVAGFRDGHLERRMKSVLVRCDGCNWRGPWADRVQHAADCEGLQSKLSWQCPVDGCSFTAPTEREVEVHMLTRFQDHVRLAAPPVAAMPRFPDHAGKDFAQLYIPSLARFHEQGESVDTPTFLAGNGYVCLMTVWPRQAQSIEVGLRFFPSLSEEAATFPFARPFSILLGDPDIRSRVTKRTISWHVTVRSRSSDPNICPPRTSEQWTGGLSTTFTRDECYNLSTEHLFVSVYIL